MSVFGLLKNNKIYNVYVAKKDGKIREIKMEKTVVFGKINK